MSQNNTPPTILHLLPILADLFPSRALAVHVVMVVLAVLFFDEGGVVEGRVGAVVLADYLAAEVDEDFVYVCFWGC